MQADQNFINHIERELSWNGAKVTYIPGQNLYEYDCFAGQSVTKDIKKACMDFGVTTKVYPADCNGRWDTNHTYFIEILKYKKVKKQH